ncbi:MAG: TonB-dependent receptor [Maribacter sp.]|nr:TonB-dependent receptor [Maribacter sp.]
MKALSFSFLLFVGSSYSLAQENIQKDSITRLDEVILIDTLKIRNATGIVPSSGIGARVFENYSPIDITSSINQISGVYVLSGALNTNRITIRGVGARTPFGTDKLRLYFDDIPVTNGAGSSTIEAYDVENLQSIEVIKGPKGTAYGTNLGGAIVLNSKDPYSETTEVINNFTIGSYGLLKNNFNFSHAEDQLSVSLQYGHMNIDGYRENNRFQRDGILLKSFYKINTRNKIGLLVNYIDYYAQIASSISQSAFDENPKQAAFTWKAAKGYEANKYTLVGLSYLHKFRQGLENTTSIFYTYLDHYEPRPFNILDEFTNGYGVRTRFSGAIGPKEQNIKYSLGAELYKDTYDWGTFENLYENNNGNGSLQGDPLSENKELRRQLNLFGYANYLFAKNFTAQVGLNINSTNYDFKDLYNTGIDNKSAKRNFSTIFLPSLDLNYEIASGKNVYANISRGFSNPSLEETLTPQGVINPDIKQETGTNYEVGSLMEFLYGRLQIELALYRMDIKNLLVAQRVGEDQFIGKNAGRTEHQGLDLDANYRISVTQNFQISPFISYSLSDDRFVEFIDADTDYSGHPLTGVPKHRLNFGAQLQWANGFYWNSTLQYVDKIPLTDATSLYSKAFTLINTRMGYKKEIFKGFIAGLDFGINNMGDTKYAQSVLINAVGFGGAEPRYFYPGNGRNIYGGLRIEYLLP